ncbi:endoplasmic reticulum-based factor for assembly of V-ATPase-domain-containing protein [Boeremia exigua]|uniref:endoplasmic reticulum-based factor for assembly of V-ATPase-domain-containing protein n=1 Tax=Boeremia exigua TaxID=749465 RepID=UPI001E8EB13B|nr:endoplasmic reticulum-based factor for assembly of V-ATPase-domain-containing protein [Boeremia exigua]KAH6643896.1 endoplasmic reticulum-based factor for assembly of V-ATPase-domain-containing protein [Boeremia exigua]
MVLLTVTPGIARALSRVAEILPEEFSKLQKPSEPVLAAPKPGNPISHSQLIDLSKLVKQLPPNSHHNDDTTNDASVEIETPTTLNALLRNTTIYVPPPPPKKQQTPEYHALMARLRAEEEARAYERMLNPPPTRETFTQRFPNSRNRMPDHFTIGVDEVDDVSYEEVHRQIILIINVLISIVCVAVFVWVAARHWSVGKRLGLSMGSSLAVAIAEVVVYSGYVRKVQEAKTAEKKKPEIKEIVASWVLDRSTNEEAVLTTSKEKADDGVRYRKGKHR